jgi:MFS family permease
MKSLTDIMKSPISRYTTIGASFRYFGQFASDYYLPLFYLSNYTEYKAEFALVYSLINLVCGFISSLAGGLLSDKFGKGKPMLKAWICIGGNMIAMPFFVASVLTTDNFWLSISFTALRFLFGEPWRSPSVTMMQNSSNPEKFGNLVSAYQFYQKMSSVVAAFIIGALFKRFDVVANPVIIG